MTPRSPAGSARQSRRACRGSPPRVSSTDVADLPVPAPGPLAERLRAAVDVEGKIVRALDALGPLAGRDVALLDVPDGLAAGPPRRGRHRRPAILPAIEPLRLDLPGREPRRARRAVVRASGASTRRSCAEADRVLRPGGRLLVVHDYGRDDVSALRGPGRARVPRLEPPRRPVPPRRRVQDPRPPLLLDVRRRSRTRGRSSPMRSASAARPSGPGLKRPRLSWNVAVYHRWQRRRRPGRHGWTTPRRTPSAPPEAAARASGRSPVPRVPATLGAMSGHSYEPRSRWRRATATPPAVPGRTSDPCGSRRRA